MRRSSLGKICIHPRQVALAHQVFTPTAAELAHAREILAAGQAGVTVVGGEMVDEVHVRMARAVLARGDDPPRPPREGMARGDDPPRPPREGMARGDDPPRPPRE